MDVYVLGDPHLRIGGRERPFPAGRPGRLLASLLVARGRVVTDDRLVDDVWGEDLPVDARAALHTTVGRARRALGPEGTRIGRTAVGYRLDLTGVDVDADRFAAGLARARALEDSGRLAAYDEALALWRGPAWAGLAADVAQGEALRLEEAHVGGPRGARGGAPRAGPRTRGGGRAAPARRRAAAARPAVPAADARTAPARCLGRRLDRLRGPPDVRWPKSWGWTRPQSWTKPSATSSSARRTRREAVAATHATTGDITGDATGETTGLPTATVPDLEPTRRLIGRDDDIEQVRALTARHRCVTVVGPGGVGKTSLARAVAATEQVAWWGDLTSVSTEAGVRAIVATALGVEVFPGGSAEAALHRRLETATGLLVLDNCEHVLAAVGDLVTEIAAAGAGIRVLATSRERLGLPVEQVYPLAPLRLPGAGVADADVPSVALFLERARASAPDLEATPDVVRDVAELVRRLDGLPLAIELAASRVGVVSLATLRDRLDDRLDLLRSHHRRGPARHQTLVDTIDWSYDLLDEDHRRALRRLSVFVRPVRPGRGGGRARPGLDRTGARSRRAVPARAARADAGRLPHARDRPCVRAGTVGRRRETRGWARPREVGRGCRRGGARRDVGPGRGVVDRAGRGPAARVRPGGLLGSRDRPGRGGDAHRRRPVLLGRLPRPLPTSWAGDGGWWSPGTPGP